jgi:hypothetical protein
MKILVTGTAGFLEEFKKRSDVIITHRFKSI